MNEKMQNSCILKYKSWHRCIIFISIRRNFVFDDHELTDFIIFLMCICLLLFTQCYFLLKEYIIYIDQDIWILYHNTQTLFLFLFFIQQRNRKAFNAKHLMKANRANMNSKSSNE